MTVLVCHNFRILIEVEALLCLKATLSRRTSVFRLRKSPYEMPMQPSPCRLGASRTVFGSMSGGSIRVSVINAEFDTRRG